MRKTIILFLILLSAYTVNAQNFSKVMDKVVNLYQNTDSYKINLKYIVFSDSISMVKKDELSGELIKNKNDYYFNMSQTEMFFTNTYNLKISHSEKLMVYSKTITAPKELLNSQTPFLQLIDKFNNKVINDKGNFWECKLDDSIGLGPYNKIVLHVSKKTYQVLKQVYYFNTSIEKHYYQDAEKTKNERLEIVQTQFELSPKVPNNLFNINEYIIKNDKAIRPSNDLKNYKIIAQ